MYKLIIKPFFDFFISLFLILLFSPIIIIVILILCISNNGQVFFLQLRPGLYNIPFYIIKFKTMRDNVIINNQSLTENQRITKIGKFLRASSIDELLQLFNVLKGDMSIVGPRPLLMEYLSRYNQEQLGRHNVKPGITGLAQINGRNIISWDKKFKYDIEYVDQQSFLLDIKIMYKTIINVLKKKDINSNNEQSMHEFIN